jgi:LPXTG-motif cell wall-anchored protein
VHFKMYKAGKRWTVVGLALLTMGTAAAVTNQASVAAATDGATNGKTADDTGSVTDADTSENTSEQTDTDSGTDAATQQDTKSTNSQPTTAGQQTAVDKTDAGTQQQSATPTADTKGTAVADTSKQDDTSADATSSDGQSNTDANAQSKTATQTNTQDVADAVTTSAHAMATTVAAGDQAGFKLNLDSTGIKTTLHHAKLSLSLPTGKGVALASDLSSLAINGVTPTLSTDGTLMTYDFGDLTSGVSAAIQLGMKTSAAADAAKTLSLQGQFTSYETTIDIPEQTVTLTTSPRAGLTNAMSSITATKDTSENHTNPIAGDTVNFDFGAWIPTAEGGTTLVKPGSTIKVQYALGPDLSYVGMVAGTDKVSDEPTVQVNSEGYTILSWDFVADSEAQQATTSPTYKFTVQAKVADDVTDFTKTFTQANLSFTSDEGQKLSAEPSQASFTISPYDPRGRFLVNGVAFVPNYTYNTADGVGNAANESGTNPDPTVELENDPVMFAHTFVTSGAPGTYSTDNTLRYLALHVLLDPNTVLQGLKLDRGYYFPNSDTGQNILADEPYASLAVKYEGEGDDVYHVLKGDINMSTAHTYTRADLIAMGLDPDKAVVNMYLYYHQTTNPDQNIPANVDTFFTENTDSNSLDLSIPDYTGFPTDAGVVNGFFENVGYWTSVANGYTGKITSQAYVQVDDADTSDEVGGKYAGKPSWWQHDLALSDNKKYINNGVVTGEQITTDNQSPATVEVVHAPQGVDRVVTAGIDLGSANTTGVQTGANTLKLHFTLGDNALVNLTTEKQPFSAYILLPAGVSLSSADTSGATVVNADYNGAGQQLIKASWKAYMVTAGQTMSLDIGVDIADDAPSAVPIKAYIDLGEAEYTVAATQEDQQSTVTKQADTADINANGTTTDSLIAIESLYNIAETSQLVTKQNITGSGELADGTASTTVGGQATVTLNTSKDTEAKISALELVDVLPASGATGLTTSDARTAEYNFTLAGSITLPAAWNDKATVTYSTSATPDVGDASQWQTADKLTDWSSVTAFRISIPADSGIVVDGGSQQVSFVVNAPTDPTAFMDGAAKLADNTYALSVNGLQQTEPHAVELAIEPVSQQHGVYSTTRTIHYQTADGTRLHKDTVQTVNYKTVASSLDQRTIYTPEGIYAEQSTPLVAGYTADQEQVAQQVPVPTDATPQNSEVTVIYTPDELVHGTYKTTRTIHYRYADGSEAEQDIVQTVNYKTVTNSKTGETVYTPTGVYAAQDSPAIKNYTPSVAVVAMQAVGATTTRPQDTEVTVVYTGDAINHGTYQTTRTIHYRYADGRTALGDIVQKLTYKTATDTKTGVTVYTPQGIYGGQSTPALAGYTADISWIGAEAKAASVTTPQNEERVVTFTKVDSGKPGNPGGNTTTPGNPGGNTTTPGNPGGNTTTPGNPGGNPTTPGNPGGNPTAPVNPDGNTTGTTIPNEPSSQPTPDNGSKTLLPNTYGEDDKTTTTTTTVQTPETNTVGTPKRTATGVAASTLANSTVVRRNGGAELPQTGDADPHAASVIGLALASVFGLLGLSWTKRRKS